ncbi:NAD(P)-dependent oxidoreductase [Ornithinimicrobium sp. Y1847]|uniref:NAD(P)-dependent oxidoreductase n=1 Tax=Ornithinimicrobium sp. Y1847 TaxID=3405419 RepID=UPI003B67F858
MRAAEAQPARVKIGPWFDEDLADLLREGECQVIKDGPAHVLVWLDRGPGEVEHWLDADVRMVQASETGDEKWSHVIAAHPGIDFRFAAGAYSREIAEHGLALVLALMRDLPRAMAQRSWARLDTRELSGATALILGHGRIGATLGSLLRDLGVRCYGLTSGQLVRPDGSRLSTTLADLLGPDRHLLPETLDIVCNVLPLTAGTRSVVGKDFFDVMGQGSYFVNIGRGGTVDQEALIEALAARHLRGAGLDVVSPEPLPADSRLWDLDNVIITSHSANPERSRSRRLGRVAMENIAQRMEGKQLWD